ncbi:MAG: hypothetical protein ACXVP5_10835 [Tumebacillaceae bacterium]
MNKRWGVVCVSVAALLMLYGCGKSTNGTSGQSAGTTSNGASSTPAPGIAAGEPTPGTGDATQHPVLANVPKDVTKIEISYKPAKPNPPTIQRTITDPAQIAKIVAALNGLQDMIGTHHCMQDYGQQATLKLYPSSGDPVDVTVVPSCNNTTIGGKGFPDEGNAVWGVIQQVMGDK